MATWGPGLIENDTALDTVDEMCGWLHESLVRLADIPATNDSAGQLAAVIGLLGQFHASALEAGSQRDAAVAAIRHHGDHLDRLPARARGLLAAIDDGDLAPWQQAQAHPDDIDRVYFEHAQQDRVQRALRALLTGFATAGRQPALFAHPASVELAQRFADHCADHVDAGLGPDLWEIQAALAALAMLLAIAPCTVPATRLSGWRAALRARFEHSARRDDIRTAGFIEYCVTAERALDVAAARWGRPRRERDDPPPLSLAWLREQADCGANDRERAARRWLLACHSADLSDRERAAWGRGDDPVAFALVAISAREPLLQDSIDRALDRAGHPAVALAVTRATDPKHLLGASASRRLLDAVLAGPPWLVAALRRRLCAALDHAVARNIEPIRDFVPTPDEIDHVLADPSGDAWPMRPARAIVRALERTEPWRHVVPEFHLAPSAYRRVALCRALCQTSSWQRDKRLHRRLLRRIGQLEPMTVVAPILALLTTDRVARLPRGDDMPLATWITLHMIIARGHREWTRLPAGVSCSLLAATSAHPAARLALHLMLQSDDASTQRTAYDTLAGMNDLRAAGSVLLTRARRASAGRNGDDPADLDVEMIDTELVAGFSASGDAAIEALIRMVTRADPLFERYQAQSDPWEREYLWHDSVHQMTLCARTRGDTHVRVRDVLWRLTDDTAALPQQPAKDTAALPRRLTLAWALTQVGERDAVMARIIAPMTRDLPQTPAHQRALLDILGALGTVARPAEDALRAWLDREPSPRNYILAVLLRMRPDDDALAQALYDAHYDAVSQLDDIETRYHDGTLLRGQGVALAGPITCAVRAWADHLERRSDSPVAAQVRALVAGPLIAAARGEPELLSALHDACRRLLDPQTARVDRSPPSELSSMPLEQTAPTADDDRVVRLMAGPGADPASLRAIIEASPSSPDDEDDELCHLIIRLLAMTSQARQALVPQLPWHALVADDAEDADYRAAYRRVLTLKRAVNWLCPSPGDA